MLPKRIHSRSLTQLLGCVVPHIELNWECTTGTQGWKLSSATRYALGLALLLSLHGDAQNSRFSDPFGSRGRQASADSQSSQSDRDYVEEERRLRALNAERHRSMVSDTNKLLKLAQDFDVLVKKNDTASFDSEELAKLAEIEKLAHKVKEKMSTSVRGNTDIPPIRFPQIQ